MQYITINYKEFNEIDKTLEEGSCDVIILFFCSSI